MWVSSDGYLCARIGNTIKEIHRYVAERVWGIDYVRWKAAHHINGDKLDNRPSNLQIMSLSDHRRLHMIGYKHSDETKKKIACSKKGENNPNYGRRGKENPLYGRPRSEETKRKYL